MILASATKHGLVIGLVIGGLSLAIILAALIIFVFRPMNFRKMMRELDKKYEFTHALVIGQDAQYVRRLEIISRTNLLYVDIHTKFSRKYKELREQNDADSTAAIYEAKDNLNARKYKLFKVSIEKAEKVVELFSNEVERFTTDLQKVIKPEEDCRQSALEYKEQLRHIKQDYYSKENELGLMTESFTKVFEMIDELFGEFEDLTDSAHYDEANAVLPQISEVLHELTAHLQELPSLCALVNTIVPDKIHDIECAYKILIDDRFPLHNLFVKQTTDTMRRNLEGFKKRIQEFDTRGVRENLDNMIQQLDDLELKFSKEKEARIKFEEINESVYSKVNQIEKRFITLKNTIPEVAQIFVINEAHENKISEIQKGVNRIDVLKRSLDTYIHSATRQPYTILVNKINEISEAIEPVLAELDEFDSYISSLKNDAETAYDLVYATYEKVRKAEELLRLINLPAANEKYTYQLNKMYNLLDEINTILTTQPIAIDRANSLIRELTEKSNLLLDDGEIQQDYNMMVLVENAILYGNKHRNHVAEIDALLTQAEDSFYEGDFVKGNEFAKQALSCIKENNGRK